MANAPSFAIYYAGDAYSTANKIMGRQSAGKAFMRGVARTWPSAGLHGLGQGTAAAKAMLGQLRGDGFSGELKWIEVPHWAALAEVGALYYPSPVAKDFARFAHFPSQTLGGDWLVTAQPDAQARLRDLLGLAMANYAFDASLLPRETIVALLTVAGQNDGQTVNALLGAAGVATPVGVRCLMWLWKFDLVKVEAR